MASHKQRCLAPTATCSPPTPPLQCPNGKDCKYRHALPPGYVLKSQMKELLELEAANVRRAASWQAVGLAAGPWVGGTPEHPCPPLSPLGLPERACPLLGPRILQKQSVEEAIEEERAKVEAKTPVTVEVGGSVVACRGGLNGFLRVGGFVGCVERGPFSSLRGPAASHILGSLGG